jgi:hypothetical protein
MLLALPRAAAAQLCFRGQPLPHCTRFFVTSLGYSTRLNGGPGAQQHYLSGDVGMMTNQSERTAVGATLLAGALVDYDFQLRFGVKPRLRRWLGRRTSVELGAGPLITTGTGTRIGLTSDLALNLADQLSLVTQWELLGNPNAPDLGWYLGARLGAKPAVWSGLIVGALLGIGAALYSGG